MRKIVMSLIALAGLALAGAAPASAGAAMMLARDTSGVSTPQVEQVHWRRHHRHHRRHWGGVYFGVGAPYWAYAPRYSYYDGSYYSRPRYYYRGWGNRHHHRHHRRW